MITQPMSNLCCCGWFPTIDSECKKLTLFLIGIIICCGVSIAGSLGIAGLVPELGGWVGRGIVIATSVSALALLIAMIYTHYCQGSALPRHDLDEERRAHSSNNTETQGMFSSVSGIQNNPGNALAIYLHANHNKADYQRMLAFVDSGQIRKAWELYVEVAAEESGNEHLTPDELASLDPEQLRGWVYLPPKKLLNAIVDIWLTTGTKIVDKVGLSFIKDCAIAYYSFGEKCIMEDQLWSCFLAYQEYIADIAAQQPFFGVLVMISKRGKDVVGDDYRMEIFRSSFSALTKFIKDPSICTETCIRNLAHFLLSYAIVIDTEDYKKITLINSLLREERSKYFADSEEYRLYSMFITLMDLVEGKLSFQGIYQGPQALVCKLPVDHCLVHDLFNLDWIENVGRKIAVATEEDSIRKGLLYLSLIPKESPHYVDAQFMLGNVWLDLENFSEAGECFLQIAELNNEHSPDALKLATMSLLAVLQEENKCVYVLREDFEDLKKQGKNMRELNLEEYSSFDLNKLKTTVIQAKEQKL